MINAGICQLVGGYPLIQSSLVHEAGIDTTHLPPIKGLPAERREEMIKGSPLVAGPAYYFAGITPVFGAHVPEFALASLDDLKPYKIGNRPSSIGDLITMAYKKGVLIQSVTHVDARLEPLDALSRSEFDVTLSEAHKFDMYQAAHPQSGLRASGLMLPVGFNLGFVSTQEHAVLLNQVGNAVAVLLENGALHKAARDAGLTYITPASPAVGSGLGLEKMTQ
jgi:ABC-type amino acid transport substrate-binding protein